MRHRLAAALAFLAVSPPVGAEIFGSTFRSAAWGVEMTVPRGWELSEQSSYPGIIARGLEHKGGGRLSLAASRLEASDTLGALVERNQQALRKLRYRFTVSTHSGGAVVVEATTPDRKRSVRQAYLARNGIAYVLSVASTSEASTRYLRPFDDVLRSLAFSAPRGETTQQPPPASRPDAGAPPAAGTTTP